MKKFFADFRKFISKGNIMDLAVAVVIGNAFNAIVNSLVKSIIMPLVSILTGGINIASWKWVIVPEDTVNGIAETAVYYGEFIQAIVNFLIIAFSIFVALKVMMKIKGEIGEVNKSIKKSVLSKEERQRMLDMGLNPKKKKDIKKFVSILDEEEKQKQEQEKLEKERKAQEEKLNNPSEQELLKEIRDILKSETIEKKTLSKND